MEIAPASSGCEGQKGAGLECHFLWSWKLCPGEQGPHPGPAAGFYAPTVKPDEPFGLTLRFPLSARLEDHLIVGDMGPSDREREPSCAGARARPCGVTVQGAAGLLEPEDRPQDTRVPDSRPSGQSAASVPLVHRSARKVFGAWRPSFPGDDEKSPRRLDCPPPPPAPPRPEELRD